MKTAKEWIAEVKDPVIKRYLEENVTEFIIDGEFPTFYNCIDGCFYAPETKQGDDFWYEVSVSDPSILSYSDFKHLDKSVEQPKVSVNEDAVVYLITNETDGIVLSAWHNFEDAKKECKKWEIMKPQKEFMVVEVPVW